MDSDRMKPQASSSSDDPKHSSKRTEMVSVRLVPYLRYAAEIAARSQRRSVSSLIEVALAAYLPTLEVMDPVGEGDGRPMKLMKLVESVWDPDESDRFVNLAENHRWLLDNEEEHRWKAVREHFNAKGPLTREQRKELGPIYESIRRKATRTLRDVEINPFDRR